MSAETMPKPTREAMSRMQTDALAMDPYMDAALEAKELATDPLQYAAVDAKSGAIVGAADVTEQRMVEDINRKRAEKVVAGAKADIFTVRDARKVFSTDPSKREDYASGEGSLGIPMEMPGKREISWILQTSQDSEAEDGLAAANQASYDTLQSSAHGNTGINNRDFAAQQFRGALYGARLASLKSHETHDPIEAAQFDEQVKATLGEADIWEKAARGEALAADETATIRSRALNIRQAYENDDIEVGSAEPVKEDWEERLDDVPDDGLERSSFAEEQFSTFNEDKLPLMKAYLQKEVMGWGANVPEGSRYPDTIAGIFGVGMNTPADFFRVAASRQEGRIISPDEFRAMQFSEATRKYLGFDIRKAYPQFDDKFRFA